VASTLNAAAALGVGETHGSLEVGKAGDCFILEAPSWEHVVYQMKPPIGDVFKDGVSSADALDRGSRLDHWRTTTAMALAADGSGGGGGEGGVQQPTESAVAKSPNVLEGLADGIPMGRMLEPYPALDDAVPHAPPRAHNLSQPEKRKAVQNALRCASILNFNVGGPSASILNFNVGGPRSFPIWWIVGKRHAYLPLWLNSATTFAADVPPRGSELASERVIS
jgi:hypothetical protein